MKTPEIVQFFIHQNEEGGYYAEAIGFSIYTQGKTMDETVRNIREAVICHFGKEKNDYTVPVLANFQIPQFA